MGSGLVAEIATDEEINTLLNSGDLVNFNESEAAYVDWPNFLWLVVKRDSVPIGMAVMIDRTNCSIDLHIGILCAYKKLGRLFAKCVVNWIWDNLQDMCHISTDVPTCYPQVKNFVVKCGFEVEGLQKQCIKIDGELHDRWLLGLRR
jgi:hypothetical protein